MTKLRQKMTAHRMKPNNKLICIATIATIAAFGCGATTLVATTNSTESAASAGSSSTNTPLSEAAGKAPEEAREQSWNWHVQNTDIVQGDPGFPAQYSGPNSLESKGEVRETVSQI